MITRDVITRGLLPAGLLGALLLAGCGGPGDSGAGASAGAAEDEKETEKAAIPVEVAAVARDDIFAVYSGTAALEAFAEAEVVAKVGGEIREVLAEEGETVQRGQVLARLDGDRLRLELEQARANLARAEQEYQRNTELHEKGLLAAGAFENLKFELDALRAAWRLARLEYSYTEIRAPIDGVVSERHVKVGNTISANTPMFRVTDLEPIVSYLHVPEKEFGKIEQGQPVFITIDALPGERFRGAVERISPVVDAGTGTFKVTVEVDEEDTALKPGMFGRLDIVYDSRPARLLVPRPAVVETESGPAVYVVRDGVVERRPVQTGIAWQNHMEIVSGVEESEQVVVVGQSGLRDGARVKVVADEETAMQLNAEIASSRNRL
ncbi:efflux RND transporter periplasmic adaptor subunit [Lentisalinibacter orientalis]|uniref:efflux RND transporter periplasmic adaptor subunit n=1 Tax=Lentisalinibacter orientalis TaxID=2992241 RepID=UPI00386F047C